MTEKTKQAIVNYGTYAEDSADAEKKALAAGRKFMKIEVGDNIVRFLPPPAGKTTPFLIVSQHFFQPNPVAKAITVNCPRVMANRPCPICKKADELSKGNKLDQAAAKKLWPRRRIFANVIDRNNEDAGPQVLAFGKLLHEDIIAYRKNKAFGDFTHPISGYDFLIQRTGTGQFDTEYRVMPAERCELGDMQWIENQADLEKYGHVLGYDEIRDAISRAMEGDDEDDAPPVSTQRRLGSAQRSQRPAAEATQHAPARAAATGRTAQDDVGFSGDAFGDDDDDLQF